MKRQAAIAQEFDLPFWEVVKGFADEGRTIYDTARILEYSHPAFSRLVKRHGLDHWFAKGKAGVRFSESARERRGQCSPALLSAVLNAGKHNPTYYQIKYQGATDTMAGHCRRLGLSLHTARNRNTRRPGDWDYVFAKGRHYVPVTGGWKDQEFQFNLTNGNSPHCASVA